MRRPLLVQGLGCVETGAQLVLKDLMIDAPQGTPVWVLCTRETACLLKAAIPANKIKNIRLIGLSHRVFGRWLRPFIELFIALAAVTRLLRKVINLSHYGLCIGGRYVLYVHSPLMMDVSASGGWSEGRPNFLKRRMLNSCIRRAEFIVLQTQEMERQLKIYCECAGLSLPKHQVVRPRVDIPKNPIARREFRFQLFYPTSRFAHKRVTLALGAGAIVHGRIATAGLVITTERQDKEDNPGVLCLGKIGRGAVYEWFAGSDVLLFTSERETLGLPLLEALEFGLPIVAPRLPYALELLGEAGCYFDDSNPESVARAVLACHDDYTAWSAKIRLQADRIRADSATWAQHWEIFLEA